jgi:hypothetical protein
LKLLCVHPGLVTSSEHVSYKRSLMQTASCSGKLTVLARLLVESGVILPEECMPEWTNLCAAAEGGADVAGDTLSPTSDDSDSSMDDDDDEEEEEEVEDEEEEEKEEEAAIKGTPVSARSSRKRALDLREDLVQQKRRSSRRGPPADSPTAPTTALRSHLPPPGTAALSLRSTALCWTW